MEDYLTTDELLKDFLLTYSRVAKRVAEQALSCPYVNFEQDTRVREEIRKRFQTYLADPSEQNLQQLWNRKCLALARSGGALGHLKGKNKGDDIRRVFQELATSDRYNPAWEALKVPWEIRELWAKLKGEPVCWSENWLVFFGYPRCRTYQESLDRFAEFVDVYKRTLEGEEGTQYPIEVELGGLIDYVANASSCDLDQCDSKRELPDLQDADIQRLYALKLQIDTQHIIQVLASKQHLDKYIEARYSNDTDQWDEAYKWDTLSKLHDELFATEFSRENVAQKIDFLQKNNASPGALAAWRGLDDLKTTTEKNPGRVAELLNNLFAEPEPLHKAINHFRDSFEEIDGKRLGPGIFGYLLAAFDKNKYPPFNNSIFTNLKALNEKWRPRPMGASYSRDMERWESLSVGMKYQRFCNLCNAMGEYFESYGLLHDATIGSTLVPKGVRALDGQDYFYFLKNLTGGNDEVLEPKRYWVEMTRVKGHADREAGEYKFGAALWCPQKTTQGQTYYAYENVNHVRPRDVILHLPDTEGFSGVSIAATAPDNDFICPEDTQWAGQPGYLVFLENYEELEGLLTRDEFLKGPIYEQLSAAFDKYKGLFYHKTDHKLTQGAYLTIAPLEIAQILNEAYKRKTHHNLPHFEDSDESHDNNKKNGQTTFKGLINVIFYGPPGTGKTFKAINRALEIIHCDNAYCSQGQDRPQLVAEFKQLQKEGRIEFVTFHQAYSYEEFVEGIRPKLNQSNIEYELHEGVFKRIARAARESQNGGNYVLIIDEINRGNISKIFGELITLIEEDKREGAESEIRTTLPYSKKPFCVPANLYIIGTMNTADRSIALMDIALRRRFTFEEFMPQYAETGLDACDVHGLNLGGLLRALNERIAILLDPDHQVGHSFFIKIKDVNDASDQKRMLFTLWYRELVPLFQEYFYNDYEKLKQLLGKYSNAGVERGFIEEKHRKEIENLIGADEGIFSDGYVRSIHTYADADSLISALKQYVLQTAAAL